MQTEGRLEHRTVLGLERELAFAKARLVDDVEACLMRLSGDIQVCMSRRKDVQRLEADIECKKQEKRGQFRLLHQYEEDVEDEAVSDEIDCVCKGCKRTFHLVDDVELSLYEEGECEIQIRLREGGGVYNVFVKCPYCEHQHNL
jgi:hypothetical protein